IELSLDEGLELARPLGTEFNVDDLYWMDTATRTKAAADAIGSPTLTPNEARRKYFGYGPLAGGDTAYMQQQNFSLAALAARDRTNTLAKPCALTPATAATRRIRRSRLSAGPRGRHGIGRIRWRSLPPGCRRQCRPRRTSRS